MQIRVVYGQYLLLMCSCVSHAHMQSHISKREPETHTSLDGKGMEVILSCVIFI